MTQLPQDDEQPGLWDGESPPEPPSAATLGQVSDAQEVAGPAQPAATSPSGPVHRTDELWNADDVATYLGVPKRTVYAWRVSGYGPPGFRVGKHIRWQPTTVRAWVELQEMGWSL